MPQLAMERPETGSTPSRDMEPEFLLVCGNAGLRAAIRRNAVTFPSQMVRLGSSTEGNDEQERIVQLYFVHGWSIGNICQRYGLGKKAVDNILTRWRHKAVAAGFVQEIQPRKARTASSGIPEIPPTITPPLSGAFEASPVREIPG